MLQNITTNRRQDCMFRAQFFGKLTDNEIELLESNKIELQFRKGEKVIAEGQNIKELIYIKNGMVKLSKLSIDKKESIVSLARAKSFIGFLTIFSQDKYQYSITTLKDSDVCFIDILTFKDIIKRNGEFALDILSKINNVSDEIIYNHVNIASKRLRGRIAYLLIWLSKEIFLNSRFNLPLTRREIGEMINMSTANVIRMLSEFRKDGIIDIHDHTIEILKPGTLEKIAKNG